jgi:hypothetical protein
MTWHICDEHTNHGRAGTGRLRRGWSQHAQVGHAAWPRATMTGLGLLLALGGVWGMHWQGGRRSQRRGACVDADATPDASPGSNDWDPQLVRRRALPDTVPTAGGGPHSCRNKEHHILQSRRA